jgi:hypothetical protein
MAAILTLLPEFDFDSGADVAFTILVVELGAGVITLVVAEFWSIQGVRKDAMAKLGQILTHW